MIIKPRRSPYPLDKKTSDDMGGGPPSSNVTAITAIGTKTNLASSDDLSREVYGVLGIPVDVIDMPAALRKIEVAAASGDTVSAFNAQSQFLGDQSAGL